MGFTCTSSDNSWVVHIFSNTFDTFKKELLKHLNISRLDDIIEIGEASKIFSLEKGIELVNLEDRKSKQLVIKDKLSEEVMNDLTTIVSHELGSLVETVSIDNTVTLVIYQEGDYFSKHRDFAPLYSKNTKCAHLLMYLENPEKGGETAIYLDSSDKASLRVTSDVLFDKTIPHESLVVKSGRKCIALFDIILYMKLSTDTNILGSIDYLGSKINLYDKENDLQLCYCDIEIKRMTGDNDEFSIGLILDRSGRCINCHINETIIRYKNEFKCLEYVLLTHMMELDNVWIEHKRGKNIVWSALDQQSKSFIPIDPELYEKLMIESSREHAKNEDLRGFCNSCDEYIYCSVAKYYFSLPERSDLITKVVNSLDSTFEPISIPNWCTLPAEIKQHILENMSYEELFSLVRGPIVLEKRRKDSLDDSTDSQDF